MDLYSEESFLSNEDDVDVIDEIYQTINVNKAVLICSDMTEMQYFYDTLKERDYPCGFSMNDEKNHVRLMVTNCKHLEDMFKSNPDEFRNVNLVMCGNKNVMMDSLSKVYEFFSGRIYNNQTVMIICL